MDLAKRAEYQRNYRKNNPDLVARIEKEYRLRRNADPERGPKRKAYVRNQWDRAYKTDPNFHLAHNLRTRVRMSVKRLAKGSVKAASTVELLGCSIDQLRAHLERTFKPGMSWTNFGQAWHMDHKRPCAKFDLTKPEQQRLCFHYSNIQPLFAQENLKKGVSCGP